MVNATDVELSDDVAAILAEAANHPLSPGISSDEHSDACLVLWEYGFIRCNTDDHRARNWYDITMRGVKWLEAHNYEVSPWTVDFALEYARRKKARR